MTVRAMIVDDQPDIRLLLRVVFESTSEVEIACEAATGAEALEILDSCDPRVVVLDQMMPGLNGVQTAERMLARRPGQLVVLCSAYLDDEIGQGPGGQAGQRIRAAGRLLDLDTDEPADLPEEQPDVGSVVDDQRPERHAAAVARRTPWAPRFQSDRFPAWRPRTTQTK